MCIREKLFASLLALLPLSLCAQTPPPYSSPTVTGSAPARFMELQYDFSTPVSIESRSVSAGNSEYGRLTDQRRVNLKLRFPILLKSGLKIIGGLQLQTESFQIEQLSNPETPWVSDLTAKELRSYGASITVLKPTKAKRYYLLQSKIQLSGDFAGTGQPQALNHFMKTSVNGLVGWKVNPFLSWGVGFSYRYTFGRHTLYPVLRYHQTFNSKWGIEATLPSSLELRYTLSPKTLLYAGARLTGANYQLFFQEGAKDQGSLKTYSWTELKAGFRLEREIHDWLWMGASAGYRSSMAMDLSEPFSSGGGTVLDLQPGGGFYANVGLFLVVPEKRR